VSDKLQISMNKICIFFRTKQYLGNFFKLLKSGAYPSFKDDYKTGSVGQILVKNRKHYTLIFILKLFVISATQKPSDMRKIYILLILLTTLSPFRLLAQQHKNPAFPLANREAVFNQDLPQMVSQVNSNIATNNTALLYLRFNKAVDKNALASDGIVLESILQSNIYLVSFSKKLSAHTLESTGITDWGFVEPQDKINPLLLENAGTGTTTQKELLISFTKSMDKLAVQALLAPLGAQLSPQQLWKDQKIWEIKMASDKIAALAQMPAVLSITPDFKPVILDNESAGLTNTQPARQAVTVGGHDLHADGVAIGVGDNSDPLHIDYADRIIPFNPSYGNDHGFHTTGIVAGNGLIDERYKGIANKCTLVSDFFSQIISNAPYYLNDFNMVVSSNSYANIVANCGYAGTYDIYSQFTDQQMRDNPTLLHLFASANDGYMTCSPFPTSFATVAGSFSSAKNELTVGSVPKRNQWSNLNPFTSKGPTKDGRIKPEIAGVGELVMSTVENNTYALNTGTSMACPNVAGGAGLLYQRYRQLHGNQDPKSALIKTILMNGATDIGNPGPDYSSGFGTMNMGHSLAMLDSNRIFMDTINTGVQQSFTFTVPANTAKAKVMLYWNDPAAAPLSVNTLVNDLDLTVTSPSNVTTLPLVLNPNGSNVASVAAPGADHTNNVEQVTLSNPAAGTYTVKVKGFNVPEINQEYFVAYDFIPTGVTMEYPFGGEALVAGDSMIIYWEASDDTNPFTLAYSIDNGANWLNIDNNVAATLRDYTWTPPSSISSSACLVKISRNSTSQASQSKIFTLNNRPVATLNPANEQCPGSIKISWNAVTGATSYRLFKKVGPDMVAGATVTGTTYTFTGLSTDTTYWVAVAPLINGNLGMRSIALSRMPSDGQCAGIVAHGDLSAGHIIAPGSGRLYTSTALSASQPLTVSLNNFDNQAATQYRVSYKVNSGAWNSVDYTTPIAGAATSQVNVANLDLAAAGTYTITVAVTNLALTDPIAANDTIQTTVQQIDNPAMNLIGGYDEGFESTNNINLIGRNQIGLDGAVKWDFSQTKPLGRLKNFLSSAITISGTKSMSMDNNGNLYNNIPGSSYNTLTGTFNLSSYNSTVWEVRCDFDYVMSGVPKFDTGNSVWIRGSDTDPWIHLLDYQIDTVNFGLFHSGSLQLSNILANAGQSFSSSTQIRFTQYDTSRIESTYYGNGVTMDNFRLYTVTDDVAMLSVDSVFHYNCGLSTQVPLTVTIDNGVNNTIHNIALSYQIDTLPVVTEILDSLPGNDTIQYTFNHRMDLSAHTAYQLSTWVYVATDTYRLNDSILNFTIRNQPVITAFPYLENFESGNGFYYSEGANDTWQYGTPASPNINHAASGTKAWKTNLAGNYKSNEFSFLYSPCFDISQMSHPTLSFNMAIDVEPPGTSIFDRAYLEYSHDGHTWQKLGAQGQGTNWYNNDSAQAWTLQGATYWHVATIPLPNDGPIVSFRFVIHSDGGTEYEGVAIDDIHVYDLLHPIFDQSQFTPAVTQNVNAGQQADFIQGNNIGASLMDSTAALGTTTVQDYKHDQFINADSTQYYVPKNFTIQTATAPGDSVTVRFYIPDAAIQQLRDDRICYSCNKVWEVQSLGITKYDDPDKGLENNLLSDNVNGTYTFTPKNKLTWVPYDVGYYAETKVKSFSEFWFNDGGPTHDQILTAHIFDFAASHYGTRYAKLNWASNIDASTYQYELQRSTDGVTFAPIATVNAIGQNGITYTYIDTPVLGTTSVVFYRIKYTMQDNSEHLSLIRSLDWSNTAGNVTIYPNPTNNGIINLNWFKGTKDDLQWTLYNSIGKILLTGVIQQNTLNGTYQFDFSKLPVTHGIYLLKVKSAGEDWKFKIVFD
jgi:hypothetical protein